MEVAVLTGDVKGSGNFDTALWLPSLRDFLSRYGDSPSDWEIYRGDEFQLRLPPEEALFTAIRIKALLRSIKGLDLRLSIGLGDEDFRAGRVSESNGSAYQRSGRTFERLKQERISLALNSGHPQKDAAFNLILRLALEFMDYWSPVSAEIIALVMDQPEAAQREIAEALQIQQSAVSQRLKRAKKELVMDILDHYQNQYLKS